MKKKIQESDWMKVDWKHQDSLIASEVGVTRERVRQKRGELGEILRNREVIDELLADRGGHLTALRVERSDVLRLRRKVMAEIARARIDLVQGKPSYRRLEALKKQRTELRLRMKEIRRKMYILKHASMMKQLLSLTVEDLEPTYWHRPKDIGRVVVLLGAVDVSRMTRPEVAAYLASHGIERSSSWITNLLRDLGMRCRRPTSIRISKYAWNRLTVDQYRYLLDREIAELLEVGNVNVVTQWRNNPERRIRKATENERNAWLKAVGASAYELLPDVIRDAERHHVREDELVAEPA